ncbi:alpha/beta hydrolase [Gracilibacillus kekensis]|uniref:Enterochelin esterase n=1 Tax=Gracilibacillus kekensis TaxID=1027249 RepID=A0A1M7IJE7_9BACI|nr:alpha/beta hydrolase-fold protein [Gracilibacillus kekensis]SHM40728.1 Enterochelin esterase [Gracilibacillus kekensis]
MGRNGTMNDAKINSNYLQEEIEIKWYVPEGFTPFKDYQLCFMQDGDDYFQMGRVATLSDQLHAEVEIEPTIFVGIHYQDKYDRQDKYHPNGKKNNDYIQFLVKEALPFVEDALHITPVKRALIGDSLAGTLAFIVASQFPDTFDIVIMQSPYVNEKVLTQAEHVNNFSNLEVFHSIGTEETEVHTTSGEVSDFLTPNRTLNQLLEGKLNTYQYDEFTGNHTWKYWQKDLKKILIEMLG